MQNTKQGNKVEAFNHFQFRQFKLTAFSYALLIMYLYSHDTNWQLDFINEKNLITSHCEGNIDILHIGSTAIKGLYAKYYIDLLGVFKDLSVVSKGALNLVNIGSVAKGECGISGREYFSKAERKAHLHIFQTGDPNIARGL